MHRGAVTDATDGPAGRAAARQVRPSDALAAVQHEPALATAQLDGPVREVKLLPHQHRSLVTERTILSNRLRWHLYELDLGLHIPSRGMRRYRVLDELGVRLKDFDGWSPGSLVTRCRELTSRSMRWNGNCAALSRSWRPAWSRSSAAGS
jgi:transposase